MRVFNRYTFIVGHIEFGELFGVVDRFLRENNLSYQQLCYDIRDVAAEKSHRISWAQEKRMIPRRKSATVLDLQDLILDFPHFSAGEECILQDRCQLVSNMDRFGQPMDNGCTEEDIRMIAKQFPLPYYVDGMLFSYTNVNFFGREWEPLIERCDRSSMWRYQRKGSHITFSKDNLFTSMAPRLYMVIEVMDGNNILDAAPYAQAMSALLGKKYTAETELYLSVEEKSAIEVRRTAAQPLAEAACQAFRLEASRFGEPVPYAQRNIQTSNYSVAKSLKKIGKEFGFTIYRYDPRGVHFISKQVQGGHLLTLVVDVPQRFNEMRLRVSLDGFGFSHRFDIEEVYGKNQEHADNLMRICFEIIRDVEDTNIMDICNHYPNTPAWYKIDIK